MTVNVPETTSAVHGDVGAEICVFLPGSLSGQLSDLYLPAVSYQQYLDLAKHAFHVIILTEEQGDARHSSTEDAVGMQTTLKLCQHAPAPVNRIITNKSQFNKNGACKEFFYNNFAIFLLFST